MKRVILAVILAVALIAQPVMAKDITLQFEWDANVEPDMDHYEAFHRVEGQGYNYTVPIKTVPHPTTTTNIEFKGVPDNAVTKNYVVLQAVDTSGNHSGDSNEVWASIDLRVPPVSVIAAGVYNDTTETVDLAWVQASPDLVSRWKVYNATTSGGPYAEIGELVNDGSPDHTMSWAIPGDGTYYFVVVPFRDGSETLDPGGASTTIVDASYAANSNEAMVEVKVHPAPTKNFKVKIRIQ